MAQNQSLLMCVTHQVPCAPLAMNTVVQTAAGVGTHAIKHAVSHNTNGTCESFYKMNVNAEHWAR